MDQSHTSTAIRGTKGYVAPECFRNMPITVKVDVYSFGILLLEIICLRRSVDNENSTGDKAIILTDWAYDCCQEKFYAAPVQNDLEAMNDTNTLQRFVMVSMRCGAFKKIHLFSPP
ncbi:Receptor-like protein kinase [Melia azedarach]|uniref:Receptor-like protein kinase n=1 Tax=Melia azedarach TaxID=155640 RepID=A0ACC1YNQ3_MELAZ|nr:Receptor-like protein kinase [Melia azedarach]